ncbi:transcription factor MYB119-like [Olea europaea var. sylvestris]|uniref:transcription factor MYB119-like n=1 Tax=Olea europaea var. sylvestris TaxID=158386 RepID=UPI000C1D3E43|nr:transcription factor MYB119-like [Olea europaea var. sylvestris]
MEGVQHEKQTSGENLSVNVIPAPVNPDRKGKRENSSSFGYQIKGQWTGKEDRRLISLVHQIGLRKWAVIVEEIVGRVGKQCREQWNNHLCRHIKKDVLTDDEERRLIQAHERLGNRWAEIANKGSASTNLNSGTTTTAANSSNVDTPLSRDEDSTPFANFKSCNNEMDFMKSLFENNQSVDSIPVDHCQPINPAEGTSENTYSFNIDENYNHPTISSLPRRFDRQLILNCLL